MPRLKSISNLLQNASSEAVNQVKVDPSHITLFCSQKQGESLLNSLPDVKPVENLQLLPKLKSKIVKNHLRLEASAKEAYKLALSSNQIRGSQKFMVLNSKIFQNSNDQTSQRQALGILQRLSQNYKKHPKVQQKLTKARSAFPIQSITSLPQLQNKWILDDTSSLSQQILTHPYTLLVNPTILYGSDPQTLYEQCISFPFMQFMIPRYNRLLIHYYNENYKSQFAYTSGFVSRVIQHQCQHLEGKTVMDWRMNHGSMTMNDSVVQYFPKASAVLDDYSKTLRTVLKEFPDLVALKSQYFIDHTKIDSLLTDILKANSLIPSQDQEEESETKSSSLGRNSSKSMSKKLHQEQNYNSEFTVNKTVINEQLPFEDDFVVRIVKHFKKEMAKFDQKIQLGLISSEQITMNKQSSIEAKQAQMNQYNEKVYSKQIKIKYMNLQQDERSYKLVVKQQKKTRKQNRSEDDYELSDEEAEKVLAKHKKGKKRK